MWRDSFPECGAGNTDGTAMSGAVDVRGKRVTVAGLGGVGGGVGVSEGVGGEGVAGLGRFGGGIGVSKWLVAQGARVLVTDKEPTEKLAGSVKQLEGLPIEYRLGEHREEDFTTGCDLVVTSPAVPPTNAYLMAAR